MTSTTEPKHSPKEIQTSLANAIDSLISISKEMQEVLPGDKGLELCSSVMSIADSLLNTSDHMMLMVADIEKLIKNAGQSGNSSSEPARSVNGSSSQKAGMAAQEMAKRRTEKNKSPAKPKVDTEEQREIIVCDASNVTIDAFAGTGKTSTLERFTTYRPNNRFLYLAFNKAIADEAQRRFGKHVVCKTSHALAFARYGYEYKSKLGGSRARDILESIEGRMKVPALGQDEKYQFAQLGLNVVNAYFSSGTLEDRISGAGVPEHFQLINGQKIDGSLVTQAANIIWDRMRDKNDNSIRMPHDGYFKLYQLSQPDLSEYDCILLDEAQDTAMSLYSLVEAQRTGKVIVGDKNQAIYSFRGATNVMRKVRNGARKSLTNSFRFGSEVAGIANDLLSVFAYEKLKVKGIGNTEVPEDPSDAYLYRTNSGVFGFAVHWMDQEAAKETHRGIHFVGGVEGYQFDLMTDAWNLKNFASHAIKDPFIRKFTTYDQFETYANTVNDKELLTRIKLVDKYDYRIPELVARAKAAHTTAEMAGVNVSTSHKSKGLEFDRVALGDDFPDLMTGGRFPRTKEFVNKKADESVLAREEVNLYYVASTRAKCVLRPNAYLTDFLGWCEENREWISGSEREDEDIE